MSFDDEGLGLRRGGGDPEKLVEPQLRGVVQMDCYIYHLGLLSRILNNFTMIMHCPRIRWERTERWGRGTIYESTSLVLVKVNVCQEYSLTFSDIYIYIYIWNAQILTIYVQPDNIYNSTGKYHHCYDKDRRIRQGLVIDTREDKLSRDKTILVNYPSNLSF